MKLDKIDIKILALLQNDARKSYREIAKELESTAPTIINKIKNLEEFDVIRGYQANIIAENLGEVSIILLIKCNPSDLESTANNLELLENVTEVFILSNSKIFLKATLINPSEINNFLTELTAVDNILEYEYYSIINTIKEIPRAIIQENLSVTLKCYYCKKTMVDEPVKVKLDGKIHYVCCNTCAKQIKEKYTKLKNRI
jgi:DNA-binding Lrp family transcriptional regulator